MVALLAALALMPAQTQGRDALIVPEPVWPVPAIPGDDVRDWNGFGHLANGPRTWARPVVGLADLSAVRDAANAAPASGAELRLKVTIFARTDTFRQLPEGFVQTRSTLEGPQLETILATLARTGALIRAATQGQVRLVPEVEVERNLQYLDGTPQQAIDWLRTEYRDRVNEGVYEADDGRYRGPYHAFLMIVPGPFGVAAPVEMPNGTAASIAYYQSAFPNAVLSTVWGAVQQASLRQAFFTARIPAAGANAATFAPDVPWSAITSFREPTAAEAVERAIVTIAPPIPGVALTEPVVLGTGTTLEIVQDRDRGPSLLYRERSPTREGGAGLPVAPTVRPGKRLSFWAKTTALDGVALLFEGGRQVHLNAPPTSESLAYALKPDGKWQRVTVDLEKAGVAGRALVGIGIPVAPNPFEDPYQRRRSGPLEVTFSDFALSDDAAPTAELPAEGRAPDALAALVAKGSTPALLQDLASPNDQTRMEAVFVYLSVKDPAAEELLGRATFAVNPRVAAMAVLALQNQGTLTAKALIRRSLRGSTTDLARAVAAEVIGQDANPLDAADLATRIADPSPLARRAAVRALARIPGRPAALLRMGFLAQTDPQVKLVVIENADPNEEFDMRKLLWEVVNVPRDAVRVAAALRLASAKDPQFRTEGLKAVRDDSAGARRNFLTGLATRKDPADRPTVLLGLSDAFPSVRAAAIRALGLYEAAPTNEELAPVLGDAQPFVQAALLELALARQLSLTPAAVAQIKASADPTVRARAQEWNP